MNKRGQRNSRKGTRDRVLEMYYARKSPRAAIVLLKTQRTYTQAKELIPRLGAFTLNPDLREAILGSVIAQKWDCVLDYPLLSKSENWLQEMGWLSHGFRAEADRINSFIESRSRFGRYYLLGDYASAERELAEIAKVYGFSLWLAEREFMLFQAKHGFFEHKERLSKIQSNISSAIIGYLITTHSNRLEQHVSPEAYIKSSQDVLKKLRSDGYVEFASWIEFQTTPWSFEWLKDRPDIIWNCTGKTLIDRYDKVIKVLVCSVGAGLDEAERAILYPIVRDLSSAIRDRQLLHVLMTLNPGHKPIHDQTNAYFDALDLFVQGRYEECAVASTSLLLRDPTCFHFYWLLARALACSSSIIPLDLPEESIARQIVENLFLIAENRTAINIPLANINAIALKLGDNHLGLSLWQFAQHEEQHSYSECAIAQIGIQGKIDSFDPVIEGKSMLLMVGCCSQNPAYNSHICVQLRRYEQGDSQFGSIDSKIASIFASIAKAKRFAAAHQYSEVISELDSIRMGTTDRAKDVLFHAGTVALLEFDALLGLDKAEEAASAVIQNYIRNPNILRHVPFGSLIEGCLSGRWSNLRRFVFWPILVYLNNGSHQDIYEAVDDLLLEHGCSSPLQIADGTIECTLPELRIILRDVLVARVISRGALWNRTAEQRRNMRKHFLQRLYSISDEDQEYVVEELSALEKAQVLELAYRNIEGPKFNLNYSEINRNLAAVYEGLFVRYTEYREYEEKGGVLATDDDLLNLAKVKGELTSSSETRRMTSELLLSQMAIEAFIEYILNTGTGLNASLGTRIRHGSLENQLTRVFGAHSLLAVKTANGAYECDRAVLDKIAELEPNLTSSLEQAYFCFTDKVRGMVDDLINQQLRVRLPANVIDVIAQAGLKTSELRSEVGLLDLSKLFSSEVIGKLKNTQFSSISAFLSEVERLFISESSNAFSAVRDYFNGAVTEFLSAAISELDNAIVASLPEGIIRSSLRSDILSAKGEFIQDIKIITKWFYSAEQTDTGVRSLSDAIAMASRVVDFASNGKLGQVCTTALQNETLKPSIGMLMYEVISILLRNVVQHSKVDIGQEVEWGYAINGNSRLLCLRNRMLNDIQCGSAMKRAEESIARPYDEWVLGNSPGGTGFSRIRKLLRQAGFSSVEIAVKQLNSPLRFETSICYNL